MDRMRLDSMLVPLVPPPVPAAVQQPTRHRLWFVVRALPLSTPDQLPANPVWEEPAGQGVVAVDYDATPPVMPVLQPVNYQTAIVNHHRSAGFEVVMRPAVVVMRDRRID